MVQIRNRLGMLACAAALSIAGAAHAATFDLTYTFTSGDVITGTLEGTLDGSFVDNLQAINLSFDGNAFTGTTTAQTWDPASSAFTADAPRLSTVASQNQIVFSTDDGNFSFGMINDVPNYGGQIVFASNLNSTTQSAASNAETDPAGLGTYSLVPAAVPEAGAFPMALAGLGLLGLVARRRRAQ